jgi:hypothetical protein
LRLNEVSVSISFRFLRYWSSTFCPATVEKTVKDILLLAVADGLVDSDKIGSSNCA